MKIDHESRSENVTTCHKTSSAKEIHTSYSLPSTNTDGYESIQNNQQTCIALCLAKRTSISSEMIGLLQQ